MELSERESNETYSMSSPSSTSSPYTVNVASNINHNDSVGGVIRNDQDVGSDDGDIIVADSGDRGDLDSDDDSVSADDGICRSHSDVDVDDEYDGADDNDNQNLNNPAHTMPEGDPKGNVNPQGVYKPRWGPKHAGAQKLASLYSREKRIQEIISTAIGIALIVIVLVLLLKRFTFNMLPSVVFAAFFGILTADFLSGLVHWAADSFGSVDTFIGKHFIRSFREHHVDPTAITRHDFIECNGDNFLLVVPKLSHIVYQHATLASADLDALTKTHWFFLLLGIYIAITNQIHKWSHTYFGLAEWVQTLQRWHIILSRNEHKKHHISPHACAYCITTGWLNPILDHIRFWQSAEWVVTKLTGAKPRVDDLKWARTS